MKLKVGWKGNFNHNRMVRMMINSNRLFFDPAVSVFLVLIPVIGVFVWLLVIIYWHNKNQQEIHRFFKGQNYEQNEASENTLRDLK